MHRKTFDFEKKFRDLKDTVDNMILTSQTIGLDLTTVVELLKREMVQFKESKYKNLSAWEKVLMNRSPERPSVSDYLQSLCEGWLELHGDRCFGDDPAVIGGIAKFDGEPITVLGYRKGKNTQENLKYNFGMPHPEGYRKVQRLLWQAEKFRRPVLTMIDTPGAHPGLGAEERGQAWAISQTLMAMSSVKAPVIAVITGEGGSGGALALTVSDRVLMLSNAVFAVASPEVCTSILWRNSERVEEMATAMKITAADLYSFGIVDEIIEEPIGGAHEDFEMTVESLRSAIKCHLKELKNKKMADLLEDRYRKYSKIGLDTIGFLANRKDRAY